MFVGLHVPTDFQMYRHNSEENIMGRGNCPPLATLVLVMYVLLGLFQQAFCGFHWHFLFKWYFICHSVFVLLFVEIDEMKWKKILFWGYGACP